MSLIRIPILHASPERNVPCQPSVFIGREQAKGIVGLADVGKSDQERMWWFIVSLVLLSLIVANLVASEAQARRLDAIKAQQDETHTRLTTLENKLLAKPAPKKASKK
jgi:hypothetical protein